MAQVVYVFIASPSDVKPERRYADEAVRTVSARTRDSLGIALQAVLWEDFLPGATKEDGERVQDQFTSKVSRCGIFIGILNQRYGTEIDETRSISGTEEEFRVQLKVAYVSGGFLV